MAKSIIVPRGTDRPDGPYRAAVSGDRVRIPRVDFTPFTVAGQPAGAAGGVGYCSNGDSGARVGCCHDGSIWRRLALGSEVALYVSEFWSDDFDDATIGPLWTQHAPGHGSISEASSALTIYCFSNPVNYWDASNKLYGGVRVALADVGTITACLFRITATFTYVSSYWCSQGACFYEDEDNMFGAAVGNQGGLNENTAYTEHAIANSFFRATRSGTYAGNPYSAMIRTFWNNHPSTTFPTENSDTLPPGEAHSYISRDGGSSWISTGADRTMTITPTHACLWAETLQPDFVADCDFDRIDVDRTDDPAGF